MHPKSVDIGRAFSLGFDAFKRHAIVTIGVILLYFVLSGVGQNIPFLGILYSILIQPPIVGGLVIFLLNVVNDRDPTVGDLFAGFQHYGRWMGTYWLLNAITIACLIPAGIGILIGLAVDPDGEAAFVVPVALGSIISLIVLVIVMLRWFFVYYAAAEGRNAIEAFKFSARLTEGVRPQLFVASIVLGLFALCGIIALGVGILVTSAIAGCAFAAIYRDLKAATEPAAAPISAPGPAPTVAPTPAPAQAPPGPAPPAPAPPTSPQWYLVVGGQRVGPLSQADLAARAQSGEITRETLVWRAGMTDWTPAGQLPDLAPLLPGPPGGAPPPSS